MSKKKIVIIIIIVVVLAIVIGVIFELIKRSEFTYEKYGTINCQPMLLEEQAELCARAEAAGYEYIAY